MPYTRDDLVKRALKNLGALPVGQTPSTEEYSSVDDIVDATLEDLAQRDIFYVPDVSAIDDAAFLSLGKCVAAAVSPEFGVEYDATEAEMKLKQIQSEVPTYKTLEIWPY